MDQNDASRRNFGLTIISVVVIIALIVALKARDGYKDERPDPEPPPLKRYVGSINSNKYHLPSCYWAGQIYKSNEIWFTSKSDARSHGYVPCKVCKP